MAKPAHKVVGDNGKPGQIAQNRDKAILSFEEWWKTVLPTPDCDMNRFKDYFKDCWKTAQENT